MHRAIEVSRDNRALLVAIETLLRPLIAFETCRVTIVSQRGDHVRRLYPDALANERSHPFRWRPIPPVMRPSLSLREPRLRGVDEMRSDPIYRELLDKDESVRRWFDSGARQLLTLPVLQNDRVVAFFTLESTQDHRFDDETLALMRRLPVVDAVAAAIAREERERRDAFNRIRRLAAGARDVRGVAEIVVRHLAKDFGWKHVAIYQGERRAAGLFLLCQAGAAIFRLPQGRVLPSLDAAGASPEDARRDAIARAASTMHFVRIRDLTRFEPVPAAFDSPKIRSMLAIPVNGAKAPWVLVIESSEVNAFSDEDVDALKLLAAEVGTVLNRSALFEMLNASLGTIHDAVIETHDDGVIRWHNRAARAMLGDKLAAGDSLRIGDLLADPSQRRRIESDDDFAHIELDLVRQDKDGTRVTVLLSASRLPQHIGGRVFVATDYSLQKELDRLHELKEVFKLVAMESRVPLALAAAWLQQMAREAPDRIDEFERVLGQMGRADLPLERLMRLFAPVDFRVDAPAADVCRATRITVAEMPESQRNGIVVEVTSEALPVQAEFGDLQFCIESLLSFGLRTRPQSRKLHVTALADAGLATLAVKGDWCIGVGEEEPGRPSSRWVRKTQRDVALGSEVIAQVMAAAGGTYEEDIEADRFGLRLRFPLHLSGGR